MLNLAKLSERLQLNRRRTPQRDRRL